MIINHLHDLLEECREGGWTKIHKAMRATFRKPQDEDGFELAKIVAEGDTDLTEKYRDRYADGGN